jgi:hypothetical protein
MRSLHDSRCAVELPADPAGRSRHGPCFGKARDGSARGLAVR